MSVTPFEQQFDLGDKVVIVTGGGRGIGQQISLTFASLGASIVIVDIDETGLEETASQINDHYDVDTFQSPTDVTDYNDIKNMVEIVLENFDRIDVLVNNAGAWEESPFIESNPDNWSRTVDTCFYGTMNCTHAVLPTMIDHESGVVINIASGAYKGQETNSAVYAAAKAAVVAFTQTVANEVGANGIRMNCVAPGATWTPGTKEFFDQYEDSILKSYPMNRLGQPGDIANAVAFLASDAASWITAEVLNVNGGNLPGR